MQKIRHLSPTARSLIKALALAAAARDDEADQAKAAAHPKEAQAA